MKRGVQWLFDGFGKKAAAKMGVGIFLIFQLGGVLFLSEAAAATGVIYVKSDAVGEGDGTSWEDAYTQLHEAIEDAGPGDQIWIASGTYVPTQLQEGSEDARTAHFHMKNNVEIYGGF